MTQSKTKQQQRDESERVTIDSRRWTVTGGKRSMTKGILAAATVQKTVQWCMMSIVVDMALKAVNDFDWIVYTEPGKVR